MLRVALEEADTRGNFNLAKFREAIRLKDVKNLEPFIAEDKAILQGYDRLYGVGRRMMPLEIVTEYSAAVNRISTYAADIEGDFESALAFQFKGLAAAERADTTDLAHKN